MSDREQELAEKYDLVPLFTEDKVDGSDVVTVDWSSLVPVLESLTTQLEAAQREVTRTDAAFAALKQQHTASDVALIEAQTTIARIRTKKEDQSHE